MSKYEINNGIYKTWIVGRNFAFFLKREGRIEVEEVICESILPPVYAQAVIRTKRPFINLSSEYLTETISRYNLHGHSVVDMESELTLRN